MVVETSKQRGVKHPAPFSKTVLRAIKRRFVGFEGRILDPFAGVGRLREVSYVSRGKIFLNEIEPEWALVGGPPGTIGDALHLPYRDGSFDVVITSPVYGSRMSDHHNARDASRRITYRHTLGRPLHPANSGQLQWGPRYREMHRLAWFEVRRVLKPRGRFLLNVSDHIRRGVRQRVAAWHGETVRCLGFRQLERVEIVTPRMRFGQNSASRADYEVLYVFRKGKRVS